MCGPQPSLELDREAWRGKLLAVPSEPLPQRSRGNDSDDEFVGGERGARGKKGARGSRGGRRGEGAGRGGAEGGEGKAVRGGNVGGVGDSNEKGGDSSVKGALMRNFRGLSSDLVGVTVGTCSVTSPLLP